MSEKIILLEVKNVSQYYGSSKKRFTAIENINLKIREGEFIALLGPSGCGKSTLLRIITGLQKPSEGQIVYRDTLLKGVNPYATIVFQTFALFPWLTVQQNVEIALKSKGIPPGPSTSKAIDLIDRVGLDGFETAYPRELSGGMRQKVGFARAMAVEPELLCLDEPFSALDILSAEALRGELMELWTEGKIPTKAILMVTHSIEEAVFMADKIVVMNKEPGRIMTELKIDLPHPRQKKSEEFLNVIDKVYATLAGQTQEEDIEMGTAPGEPGKTRLLPDVAVEDLAGLLEYLNEKNSTGEDLYKIPEEIHIGTNKLLLLIETMELLGFARIEKGDITLTSLGETFAEARILARKEIFATRIKRLPFFKWLLTMVKSSKQEKLEWGVILTALSLDFSLQEAEKQLNIAVDWGRYSEIFSYDDDMEIFFI